MNRRAVLQLLAGAVLFSGIVTSCGETEVRQTESGTAAETTADGTETIGEDVSPIYQRVPTGDFGGYQFRILNNTSNFGYTTMNVDEESGEPLDDAVFHRNRNIEEKLNITVTVDDVDPFENPKIVNTFIPAGEDRYDLVYNQIDALWKHAVEGYFLPLEQLDDLHLDEPWWNQSANESVKIGSHTYYAFGDASMMYYECYVICAFNKSLLNEYDFENPYELVHNGKWTIDVMGEDMKKAVRDLDGDGKMTYFDRFGLSIYTHNSLAFMTNAGVSILPRDEDNMLTWNGLSEELLNKYEKIKKTIFPSTDIVAYGSVKNAPDSETAVHEMFHDGRILFYVEPLGALKKFRDVDYEFGVVPIPKYDEAQESYTAFIFQGASALTVPVTAGDPERTAVISENLAAASYEPVKKAYFDVTLDFKYIQDEEGARMLDIVFANGRLELSRVFDFGGIGSLFSERVKMNDPQIVSTVARIEKKVVSEIEKTIDAFEALE